MTIELEKVADKLSKFLRSAPENTFRDYTRTLHRVAGIAPNERDLSDVSKELREHVIKRLRGLNATPEPDLVPRGSELWRKAMLDIKHGRMTTLETGTSEKAAHSILKHGPSGPIGLSMKENMPAVSDREDALLDALPQGKLKSTVEKLKSGMFAADAGTRRTSDYAKHAAGGDQSPAAVVRFNLPASLAQSGSKKEFRVSNSLFKRWSRDASIEKVAMGAFWDEMQKIAQAKSGKCSEILDARVLKLRKIAGQSLRRESR